MALTKQEIYDTVKAHLKAQGRKSADNGACLYRGPDGTKCAIGALITDENYHGGLERQNVRDLEVRETLIRSGVVTNDSGHRQWALNKWALLDALQQVHDGYEVWEWPNKLIHVAVRFNLKP